MNPAARPCPVHQNLSVALAIDTPHIRAARRAEVTITCHDCGHEVAHGAAVPFTVVERTPA